MEHRLCSTVLRIVGHSKLHEYGKQEPSADLFQNECPSNDGGQLKLRKTFGDQVAHNCQQRSLHDQAIPRQKKTRLCPETPVLSRHCADAHVFVASAATINLGVLALVVDDTPR